jgi:hypothetical protein
VTAAGVPAIYLSHQTAPRISRPREDRLRTSGALALATHYPPPPSFELPKRARHSDISLTTVPRPPRPLLQRIWRRTVSEFESAIILLLVGLLIHSYRCLCQGPVRRVYAGSRAIDGRCGRMNLSFSGHGVPALSLTVFAALLYRCITTYRYALCINFKHWNIGRESPTRTRRASDLLTGRKGIFSQRRPCYSSSCAPKRDICRLSRTRRHPQMSHSSR